MNNKFTWSIRKKTVYQSRKITRIIFFKFGLQILHIRLDSKITDN